MILQNRKKMDRKRELQTYKEVKKEISMKV
jgi:hypothetical protein